MTWLDEFLAAVLSPVWFAGLLQAALGAGLAFAGAYALVRMQVNHDRKLTEAQNKRVTAIDVGEALLAPFVDIDEMPRRELAAELLSGAPYPPGVAMAQRLLWRAGALVVGIDELAEEILRELGITWDVCREEAMTAFEMPDRMEIDEKVFEFSVGAAAVLTLAPITDRSYELGRALLAWDGMSALPGRESLRVREWYSPPGTGFSEFAPWRAKTAEKYHAHVQRLIGHYGDGRHPLPG